MSEQLHLLFLTRHPKPGVCFIVVLQNKTRTNKQLFRLGLGVNVSANIVASPDSVKGNYSWF